MSDHLSMRPPRRVCLSARLQIALVALNRWYAVGLLLCLPACSRVGEESAAEVVAELPVIDASLLTVEMQSWPKTVRSHGSLVADEAAVVGSRLEGRVEDVYVDLGDTVKAGAPLVTLSQAQFTLKVAQAEAQLLQTRSAVGLNDGEPVSQLNPENSPPVLEQKALWNEARANVERAMQLRDRNSITVADFEQVAATAAVTEARYKSALNSVREKIALIGVREAELSLAREELNDTVIRVPFDGLIQQKQVSAGTYVRIGDSIATVVRTDVLRFRGTIPERHALSLTKGQSVELQIESVPAPVSVRVTRISPALDLLSRSLLFEAVVENSDGGLRSGLFAEATVVIDSQSQAIVIPQSALSEFAGAEKVWKVVDGKCREQAVLAGERRGQLVEILEGLESGDVVLQDAALGKPALIRMPVKLDETLESSRLSNRSTDKSSDPGGLPSAISSITEPPEPTEDEKPTANGVKSAAVQSGAKESGSEAASSEFSS